MAASSFVASVWQGLVLAAGVWLCLRLLPRTTAAIRFTIWTAAFVVLALLPFLHAYAGRAEQELSARGSMLQVDVRWSFAVAGLWMLLSLLRAGRLVASGFRLRGIWKRATPVVACDSLLSSVGLRGVQLCTSCDVDCPSVIGFFSPRILIPLELFERLTLPELEQIVLHEMGHLRRRDDWINLLQKLGLVLFPLNPVLVWIERRLCFERELACDDDVLRLTRAPKAYASCLTSLAERRLDRRAVSLSLGAWERQSELARRVHRILRRGEGMGRTQARVVLSVLVLALLGGAAELSRCPRIVSFSSASSFAGVAPLVRGEAQMLPAAEYHPVVSPMQGAAHETLLKAAMPSGQGLRTEVAGGQAHHTRTPLLQRTKGRRAPARPVQQWVVLTSWSEPAASGVSSVSRMVLTVAGERDFLPSYAAVPTDGGWLVIKL